MYLSRFLSLPVFLGFVRSSRGKKWCCCCYSALHNFRPLYPETEFTALSYSRECMFFAPLKVFIYFVLYRLFTLFICLLCWIFAPCLFNLILSSLFLALSALALDSLIRLNSSLDMAHRSDRVSWFLKLVVLFQGNFFLLIFLIFVEC